MKVRDILVELLPKERLWIRLSWTKDTQILAALSLKVLEVLTSTYLGADCANRLYKEE